MDKNFKSKIMKRVVIMITPVLICGMNRLVIATVVVLFSIIFCISCNKDEENFVGIENISFDNYPKVDGSTSARALNMMIACKLLGVNYRWQGLEYSKPWQNEVIEWNIAPETEDIPRQYGEDFFSKRIMTSQTHGAFMNLIDSNADIILTHRTISPDEKIHADAVGVTLMETPIALDAFVFVVNKKNPVKSLTVNQIQKIYTKKITNWSKVGGNNIDLFAFTRPRNSGSEEVFRAVVMDGLEPADFPEIFQILDMPYVLINALNIENSICYTFNNYAEVIVRMPDVPKIAINGIFPDKNTVKNSTYPFISKVYVAIRSDLNRNSMAYKLYEWLQSDDAKSTIRECGFITK